MDRREWGDIRIFERFATGRERGRLRSSRRTLALAFGASLLLHAGVIFLIPAGGTSYPPAGSQPLVLLAPSDAADGESLSAAPPSRRKLSGASASAEQPDKAAAPATTNFTVNGPIDPSPPAATNINSTGPESAVSADSVGRASVTAPPEAAGAAAARHDAARISFLRLLEERKTYPGRARDKGIQGSVGLSVTLDAAGRARQLAVSRSSGSTILDDAALDLVRRALPFAHGLGVQFQTYITIAYRLSP